MRIGLLTREYPPEVYGGAGVHVGSIVPQLRELIDVDVHSFGGPKPDAHHHTVAPGLERANPALQTLSVDLSITAATAGLDLVHSHTWYANMAGHLAKLLHGIPHVITAHSLEPRRPWKAEQLAGGYALSCWVERSAYAAADAIIAVSHGMRTDVLDVYPELDPDRVHVVHNGVDTDLYRPVPQTEEITRFGIDLDRPIVVFVGRITRQKGVDHLVAAAHDIDPGAQVVLCAGAPDTPELAREIGDAVAALSATRRGIFWIQQMLEPVVVRQLLSRATVFVCPSVYEPLGIVNLEAMACGAAVVASDVGGIPEVVDDGKTGLLVHYDEAQPAAYRQGLAAAVNRLISEPGLAKAMGRAGRERAEREFSWAQAAAKTVELYHSVLAEKVFSR